MRHAGGGPRGPCMKSTYSDGQTTEMHVKHIMRNSPQPYRHKMYLAQPAALHAHSNPDESNTPGTRNTWPTALRCPGQSGEARRQHGAALPLPSEHSKLRSSCQPLLHKWASTPCLPPNAADTSTTQLLSGHRMTARTPKFAQRIPDFFQANSNSMYTAVGSSQPALAWGPELLKELLFPCFVDVGCAIICGWGAIQDLL